MVLRKLNKLAQLTLLAVGGWAAPGYAGSSSDADGAIADWAIDVSGDLQARYEFLDNQFRPGAAEDGGALLYRTNVRAIVSKPGVEFGFEISDARAQLVDNEGELNAALVNSLEPLQFYGKFNFSDVLSDGDKLNLQLGRFTLRFGAGRVIGRFGFRNSISSHQGIKLDWVSSTGNEVTLLAIMPGRIDPRTPDAIAGNDTALDDFSLDRTFYGVHATNRSWVPGTRFEGYALQLDEKDKPGRFETADRHLLTIGGRAFRAPAVGVLDFDIEGALQTGRRRATSLPTDSRYLDVSAGFIHAEAGYRFAGDWQPRLAFLYDFASGDKDPNDDRDQRYDSLFGPLRGDFGPTTLNLVLSRNNISALGVRAQLNPASNWNLMAHWKANWLATARDQFARTGVQDMSGASDRFAGHFIEVRSQTWLKQNKLRLELGAAKFFNGAFFDTAPNATGQGNPTYGYVQVNAWF